MSKRPGRVVLRAAAMATTAWQSANTHRSDDSPAVSALLAAVPRMVSARVSGRYSGLSAGRLALLAAALGYVVLPVDLIPESLLTVAGLADDMLVLGWASGALVEETEKFLAWERAAAG